VIYLLSFLFLIGFEFFVFRPLRQITEAATQYASGNLTYEIPVTTHDEMGYLSASLILSNLIPSTVVLRLLYLLGLL